MQKYKKSRNPRLCLCCGILSKQVSFSLQILIDGADDTDAEVLHQHIGYIGREESQQGRPEVDVLHPKTQQSEQHDDGLLFIPGDVIDDGQVVHIT